jgi:hypothetical protein
VKVGDIDLIGAAETQRMLEQWIDTDVAVPASATLVDGTGHESALVKTDANGRAGDKLACLPMNLP